MGGGIVECGVVSLGGEEDGIGWDAMGCDGLMVDLVVCIQGAFTRGREREGVGRRSHSLGDFDR